MSNYQTLTVNAMTGNTYWQVPHASLEDAQSHAFKYTKNKADLFIYEIFEKGAIRLLKSITHQEAELWKARQL